MMESSKGYKNWRCASHLTRVILLQYQLQKLSERERRARNQNHKLLQDFQKAHSTLSDLVARTEAMNNIRMEYERYLEENYPKWQQKLQEKRLSEQRKLIEQHLKACTPQTKEEGQRINRGSNHLFRINSPSAISPDPSNCPIFNSLPHMSGHRDNMAEGSKQNMQGNVQNSIHSSVPSMWLTQIQPPVPAPEHSNSNISLNTRTIQNVHQGFNSSLFDPNLLSGDPLQSLYLVAPQDPPSYELLKQYPNSWASGSRFNLRVQRPTDCPSWSHLSLINEDLERRKEEGRQTKQEATSNSQDENHHMQKQRKKMNSNDTKPVNISNYYGDSSESSDLSFKAVGGLPTEVQRTIIKRREEKQTHNTRKDVASQGSSSISDSQSVPDHKKHKRNQQSNGRKTSFKTSKVAVDSPKQLVKENEDDGNPIIGTLRSITCTVKTGGMQRYEKKDKTEEEKEILSTGEKRVNEVANGYSAENHDKTASLCEEQDKEGEQSSTDEGEAQEEAPFRCNMSVKISHLEEVDSVRESEAEEGIVGEEDREDLEKGDKDEKSRSSGRRSKEDDNESYQEGNYNQVLASGSERNIQDSLRELYKDKSEDDLDEKEANTEEEEEEEEEEDVIVERASAWSCHPVFEDKYQDDDDDDPAAASADNDDDEDDDDDDEEEEEDDIEGLLAPQNNSLQHQPDEPEEILKSKGLNTNSEENAEGKDEPVDSGDEFDHFYD